MHSLYGICNHSLIHTHTAIMPFCRQHNYRCELIYNGKKLTPTVEWQLRFAQLIIVASFDAFKAHLATLNRARGVVVVIDSPQILHDTPELQLLDIDHSNRLSYRFRMTDLQLSLLHKSVHAAHQCIGARLHIRAEWLDALPALISMFSATSFMDKYNNFLYACTKHTNRDTVRGLLLNLIHRNIAADNIGFQRLLKSDVARTFFRELLQYLDSPAGDNLYRALKEVEKIAAKASSSTQYDQIAKRYKVDKFDLKNLAKMWRYVTRVQTKPRTLLDLAHTEFERVKKVKIAA